MNSTRWSTQEIEQRFLNGKLDSIALSAETVASAFVQGGMMPTEKGYDWLLRTKLVTNANARFLLPQWISDTITQAGKAAEHIKGVICLWLSVTYSTV